MKFLFNTLAVSHDSIMDYHVYEIDMEHYHVELLPAASESKTAHFMLYSVDGLWITYHPKFIDMAPVLGAQIQQLS